MYYQNKNTYEIWKLDHIKTFESHPKDIKVYVFENGQRWCQDDFFEYWVKLEGYIPTEEELARN